MPYASPLTHIRVEGVFGANAAAPIEEWSFGVHFAGALLPAGYDAALPDIWDAAVAYIADPSHAFSNTAWLTEVMAAEISPTGALAQGFYSRFAGTPISGANAVAASLPLTTTYAVTLDAGKPAPGRFGRFFPPPQAGDSPIALGMSSAADAQQKLTVAAQFLYALQDAISPAGQVWPLVVASKTSGQNRPVTALRVGRVPDTQRRRRNSLPEAYKSTPFALPA